MKAVIIILSVLALILLFLFLPLGIIFVYDEKKSFKVTYAGICLFNSGKEKKKKAEEKKETDEKEDETEEKESQVITFLKGCYEEKGIKGTLDYLTKIAVRLLNAIKPLLKRVKFTVFLVDLTVATLEAADTAIQYGLVCTAAYPVLSLLYEYARFGIRQVNIKTDFTQNEYKFSADIRAKTPLIYALIIAIKLYRNYLSLIKENGKNE